MKPNVGSMDRVIRAIAGLALIAWALAGGPAWAYVGVVVLITAAISFCPAYRVLGITTGAAVPKG